jgi:hypothetical protein
MRVRLYSGKVRLNVAADLRVELLAETFLIVVPVILLTI